MPLGLVGNAAGCSPRYRGANGGRGGNASSSSSSTARPASRPTARCASSPSRLPARRWPEPRWRARADVDRAVAAARAALEGPWARTPPTERSRLLHALADAIEANRKELAELKARNVGKAISSVKAEVKTAAENFRFYASALALDRRAHAGR